MSASAAGQVMGDDAYTRTLDQVVAVFACRVSVCVAETRPPETVRVTWRATVSTVMVTVDLS